jgi:hypothetical protein
MCTDEGQSDRETTFCSMTSEKTRTVHPLVLQLVGKWLRIADLSKRDLVKIAIKIKFTSTFK